MNENDLSDEAFWEWDETINRQHMDTSFSQHALNGWQECRTRSQYRYDRAIECWTESIDEKNKEIDQLRSDMERAKANPWQLFSDYQLEDLMVYLFDHYEFGDAIAAELYRRKK